MTNKTDLQKINLKPLNGYRPFHRNDIILVNFNILSIQAFTLFQFYISMSDFDKNHKQYSILKFDFKSVAGFFLVSEGTIRNWNKEIIQSGLIKKISLGIYCISKPDRYAPIKMGGKPHEFVKQEKFQSAEEILQSMGVNNQTIVNSLQSIAKNNVNLVNKLSSIYKFPFKVGNGLISSNSNISNDIQEQEVDYNNFEGFENDISSENILLIDESVNERTSN